MFKKLINSQGISTVNNKGLLRAILAKTILRFCSNVNLYSYILIVAKAF